MKARMNHDPGVTPAFRRSQDCAEWPSAASESCGSAASTKTASLVCCPGGWTAPRLQAPPAKRRSWALAPPCATLSRSGANTLCVATACMPSPLARRVSPDVACVTPELVLIEHHHHCSSRWVLELTEAQFIESHAQFPLSPNNPQLRRMEESPPPLPTPGTSSSRPTSSGSAWRVACTGSTRTPSKRPQSGRRRGCGAAPPPLNP